MKSLISSVYFWSFIFPVLVLFLFAQHFSPPHFTHDSYHYLHLSLFPVVGDSHSMGLSIIFLLFAKIADLFNKSGFIPMFLFWNTIGLVALLRYWIVSGMTLVPAIHSLNKKKIIAIYLLAIAVLIPVSMGNIYLVNSVWTEMTNFLQVGLFAFFAKKLTKMNWPLSILIAVLLSVWSYHTRYLMVVVPVAFICMGLVFYIRKSQFPDYKKKVSKFIMVGLIGLVSIFSSGKIGALFLPDKSSIISGGTNYVLRGSIFCTLRCDVKLTETDCSTPEGKEKIENIRCTEFLFRLVTLGDHIPPLDDGLTPVLKKIGPWNVLKWIVKAPFVYLKDYHDIEMGLFVFGQDTGSAKVYPEATEHYKPYLVKSGYEKPNDHFIWIARTINSVFKKQRLYHVYTALAVLLSLLIIFTSLSVEAIFLCFYAFGTYMLFVYLNPHVPFRYLIQILTPAIAGILYELSLRVKNKKSLLTNK